MASDKERPDTRPADPSSTPTGGDMYHSLSSSDMDRLLKGITHLPADSFYRLRTGKVTPECLRDDIAKALRSHDGHILFIVHVRHHWVVAELSDVRADKTAQLHIFDSAPSVCVVRDIDRVAKLLQLPPPEYIPVPQQEHGSEDCGLFAFLFAMMRSKDMLIPGPSITRHSLRELRPLGHDPSRMFQEGCRLLGVSLTTASPISKTAEVITPNTFTPTKIMATWSFDPYGGGKRVIDRLDTFREKTKAPLGCKPAAAKVTRCEDEETLATSSAPVAPHLPVSCNPAPQQNNKPVIDVDEELEKELQDVHILWEQIPTNLRENLQPTFEVSASLQQKEYDKGLKLAQAEFNSLSGTDKKRRESEFKARLKPMTFDLAHSFITLHDIPRNPPTELLTIAELNLEKEKVERHKADLQDMFLKAAQDGEYLSSAILDRALQDARIIAPDWTIFSSTELDDFMAGRIDLSKHEIKDNVAAVVFKDHHFVLFTASRGQSIEVRDSLSWNIKTFDRHIEAFRSLLQQHNVPVQHGVRIANVPQQPFRSNRCAIEAINNLCGILTGERGNFSRELIRRIAEETEPLESKLWSTIWSSSAQKVSLPQNAQQGQDKEVKENMQRRHDPGHTNSKESKGEVSTPNRARPHVPSIVGSRCDKGHAMATMTHTMGTEAVEFNVCGKETDDAAANIHLPLVKNRHTGKEQLLGTSSSSSKNRDSANQNFDTEQKSGIAGTVEIRCLRGHVMQEIKEKPKGISSFTCNACSKLIKDLKCNYLMRCQVCNFDLCANCANACKQIKAKDAGQSSLEPGQNEIITDDQLEGFLKELRVGHRISMLWRERAATCDFIRWTGTVKRQWDHGSRHVQVRWDPSLPLFVGPREKCFPEADLPDPIIQYGYPSILSEQPAQLRLASSIVLRWSKGTNTGTWFGRVEREAKPDQPACVSWEAEVCPQCGEWADLENDAWRNIEFPMRDTCCDDIHVVTRKPLTLCCCPDEEDITDDGEQPNPIPNEDASKQPKTPTIGDQSNDVKSASKLEEKLRAEYAPELNPPTVVIMSESRQPSGRIGLLWNLTSGRPSHVSPLVWANATQQTRALHLRWLRAISAMPASLQNWALGPAVVELVLRSARRSNWRWSTIASAFCSVATALANLPLYINVRDGINVRRDPAFAAAYARALRLAKVTHVPQLKKVMTFQQMLATVQNIKRPGARALGWISWLLASRVGDTRQIAPSELKISNQSGALVCTGTFRKGKGAFWHGPYTLATVVPAELAKLIIEITCENANGVNTFSKEDQNCLAKALKGASFDCRAIRTGAIQWMSQKGVEEPQIQTVSVHSSGNTLRRYLGWGVASARITKEAIQRHEVLGAGTAIHTKEPSETKWNSWCADADKRISDRNSIEIDPMKMAMFSGRSGKQGRRISRPPDRIPNKAPSEADLGIDEEQDGSESWPDHIKQVGVLDWDRIVPVDDQARMNLAWSRRMCESTEYFRRAMGDRTFQPEEIPISHFSKDTIHKMLQAGKIRRLHHDEVIRGYAVGFRVKEKQKKRWRIIFEPYINRFFKKYSSDEEDVFVSARCETLNYSSRQQRRYACHDTHAISLDAAAFFDQFKLTDEVGSFMVLRVELEDGTSELFALSRLPMGARWAPTCAQSVTANLAAAAALSATGVAFHTMIDNVRFSSSDIGQLNAAFKSFRIACISANITLNEVKVPLGDRLPSSGSEQMETKTWDQLDALPQLPITVTRPPYYDFLGERYVADISGGWKLCNTPKTVSKLEASWRLISNKALHDEIQYTSRNLASLIGLIFYGAHTMGIPLHGLHSILRIQARIHERAAHRGWEEPLTFINPTVIRDLRTIVNTLLINEPIFFVPIAEPHDLSEVDVAIVVDASAVACGAYIQMNGVTYAYHHRWTDVESPLAAQSTTAEPIAATRVLQWVKERLPANPTRVIRVAVVTDHMSIVTGQRRWWSNTGGFASTNFFLNSLYVVAYGDPRMRVDFYHIPGEQNAADPISRSARSPVADQYEQTSIPCDSWWACPDPISIFGDHPYRIPTHPWIG